MRHHGRWLHPRCAVRLVPAVMLVTATVIATAATEAQRVIREDAARWQSARALPLTVVARWCADAAASGCDFREIVAAQAMPDGGIIATGVRGPLRRFAADGGFVRELGRPGQGPGEYGFVVMPHRLPDGHVTWFDNTQMRFASVREDGTPGPTRAVTLPIATTDFGVADGELVVLEVPGHAVIGTEVAATIRTVPAADAGAASRTLATVRARSRSAPGSSMISPTPLFAGRPRIAVGAGLAVAYVAGDAYDVLVVPADGASWRVVADAPRVPVTAAQVDSARQAMVRRWRVANGASLPPAVRALIDGHATAHAAVRDLAVLRDGTVAVAVAPPAGAARTRWDLFTADGRRLGRVMLPLAARITDGAAGWLLAVAPGEDDVPSVTRYRVGGPD